jgi:glycogen debranching enzyme
VSLSFSAGKGAASPLGATLMEGGSNFAVFSEHATVITVCLFDEKGSVLKSFTLENGGKGVHFGFIAGVRAGMMYGLRADGPWAPENGHRFDKSKLLLDPYAITIDRAFVHHGHAAEHGFDTVALMPKAIIHAKPAPLPARMPVKPRFIYELNVKAFSMLNPLVAEEKRGTVAALADTAVIAYLKALGADTIELLPITAWIDERHLPPLGLRNAWGYNPVSFFAVDPRLAPGGFAEVRTTVQRLHDEGLNVILDMVLNHSGESDGKGGTLSFRGLDNATYYQLHGGGYVNDTGCGNTVALHREPVVRLAVDALRHWVEACGVDGFRFDLASVMGRDGHGFSADAPLIKAINADAVLSQCILIAEPWDMGPGGYQLGHFPTSWAEWNDKFRDDVRRFWRGDEYSANALATRVAGSSDVMANKDGPARSVNFVSAHDGFTLKDLVTYASKQNHANGEHNRDGKSDEVTWLNGDVRALLATLFFSRGTPMITAGDEFGRTQRGNNNAYAQDNAVTWQDWAHADRSLGRYVAKLCSLRREFPLISQDAFLDPAASAWFDADGHVMDWSMPRQRFLGLAIRNNGSGICLVFNGSNHDQPLRMPPRLGHHWVRRFCSKNLPDCPAISVSLFEEVRA